MSIFSHPPSPVNTHTHTQIYTLSSFAAFMWCMQWKRFRRSQPVITGCQHLSRTWFHIPHQWSLLFFFSRKWPVPCSGVQSPHLYTVLTYSISGYWRQASVPVTTQRKPANRCLCWNGTHLMRLTGKEKIICRYRNKIQEASSWKNRVMCMNI